MSVLQELKKKLAQELSENTYSKEWIEERLDNIISISRSEGGNRRG